MKKTALLTKLLCVLLVLMMIAAMAVSCHTEEDDASAATGDTSTTVPLEEDTEFPEDGLNDINFGESVRIVVSESQKGQVYQEEETDNVINNAIDTISMLPYIMPGAVVGLSLLLAFGAKPFALTGTFAIMVISFVIRRLPYTIRSATATLMQTIRTVSLRFLSSSAIFFAKITDVTLS